MPYIIAKHGSEVVTTMEGVLSFHQHKEADEMVGKISQHIDVGVTTAVKFDLAIVIHRMQCVDDQIHKNLYQS